FGLINFSKTKINNGFIACTKGHPVMKNTVILMQESIHSKKILYSVYIAKTCGTEVMIAGLSEELKKNPNLEYKSYSSEFFEPKISIRSKLPKVTKNTHVIHHSDKTWLNTS